jgi:hypothetical protein
MHRRVLDIAGYDAATVGFLAATSAASQFGQPASAAMTVSENRGQASSAHGP